MVVTQGFTDRSSRLVIFGLLAVLAGAACVALGALGLLLPAIVRAAGLTTISADPGLAWMAFGIHALLGSAFVGLGIGSVRRRRWVPPLMQTLSWSWLIGGIVAVVLAPGTVDAAIGEAGGGVGGLVKLLVVAAIFVGGVLAPAVFIWIYRDRDLLRTCQRYDGSPAWTERCPTPVLGLSVGLAGCALLSLPMALHPVVPLFGVLVGGAAGAFLLLGAAAAFACLARETYRRTAAGWWGTTLFMVVLGASTVVTLDRVGTLAFYRGMGYSEEQLELLGEAVNSVRLAWVVGLFTLLTLVYMLSIRRHFRSRSDVDLANLARDG